MTTIKTTVSIKPSAEAEAHPMASVAASELMKVIAMAMGGYSIRSYLQQMTENLVEAGVLTIEGKEEAAEDGEDGDDECSSCDGD